jgi:transcription initiation factor IIE alpha subunit
MTKIVISVSKSYIHRGKSLKHRDNTRKRWHVYYYEFSPADRKYKLKSMRVNWLEALYYKAQRHHRYKYYCDECGSLVVAILKRRKSALECPICANA